MGTHWKKITNPNYLGSWDFRQGEERVLTIKKVALEEVFNPTDNAKKTCIVAYFNEGCKPMILNKTNCKTIQGLYNTPEIENWAGCSIILKIEKVKAFGKLEEGLRIKKEIPKQSKATEPPLPPCSDCNGAITDEDKYTAAQVAAVTKRRYGIPLCASCSSKRKSKGEEVNATNT